MTELKVDTYHLNLAERKYMEKILKQECVTGGFYTILALAFTVCYNIVAWQTIIDKAGTSTLMPFEFFSPFILIAVTILFSKKWFESLAMNPEKFTYAERIRFDKTVIFAYDSNKKHVYTIPKIKEELL